MKALKETMTKLIQLAVRQTRHKKHQQLNVCPHPIGRLNQKFLKLSQPLFCLIMVICAAHSWLAKETLSKFGLIDTHSTIQKLDENWAFPYWQLNHKKLIQIALTAVEQRFAKGFPGAIARFTDGETVWVVRHVKEATRMLHPAEDCFRGLGYQVSAPKVVEKMNGRRWRCFFAARGQKLQVCERIFDAENRQWTDVSAWYWETLFQPQQQEWWALTEVTLADGLNEAL